MNPIRTAVTLLLMLAVVGDAMAQQPPKRLDYRQEQSLKDARYYLDQVEGTTELIAKKSAVMKVGDASVQIQDVDNLLANKARLAQYLTNVESRLKPLPADHADVKVEQARFDKAKAALDAQDKKLTEIRNALAGVIAKGGGAEWKADFDRLREINRMFADPQIIERQPEAAIETIKLIQPVMEERKRIAAKYADLLKQTTPEAKDMNSVLRYSDEVFGKFDAALKVFVASAPGLIVKTVDDAITMGEGAAAGKKHMFFGEHGGVNQRLTQAQVQLTVLAAAAPDAPDTASARQKLEAARAKIKTMQSALLEGIVQSNQPPQERYSGADKAALIDLVKKKWAESGIAAEVLKTGINSQSWQRDTRWEWRARAWNKVDVSRIQGHIIVKKDATTALIYHINFVKDHLAADTITAYFFNDLKAEPDVTMKLALKNVK